MARIEFEGGLYFDDEAGPIMPSDCIEATIQAGAKKSRIGKDVAAAVFVSDDVVPVEYDGPGQWRECGRTENDLFFAKPARFPPPRSCGHAP